MVVVTLLRLFAARLCLRPWRAVRGLVGAGLTRRQQRVGGVGVTSTYSPTGWHQTTSNTCDGNTAQRRLHLVGPHCTPAHTRCH